MASETKELRDQIDSQKSIVSNLERQIHEGKKAILESTNALSKKVGFGFKEIS